MNPETIITVIPTMFHAAVMGLGIVVLAYLQKIHRYQQRLVRSRSEQPSDEQQRIAHLQRVVDAAEDWYDDKRGSKERLREVVAQHRGLKPFKLVGREGECRVCKASADEPCDAGLHS